MSEAKGQRPLVIVVGSSGLIGTHIVGRLAGPYRVGALDVRPPQTDLPEGAEFSEIDVTSDEKVCESLAAVVEAHDGPLASVIQLAAYYDFTGAPSDMYEKVTVNGTERVLREARKHGAEQFIFSSSMLVHAPTEPGRPLNEEHALLAKWDYPQSKVAAEGVVRTERGDMPAVLLRIAGVYTDKCDSLPLSHQIRRVREKRMTSRVYPGDTQRGQAFVHVEDLVEAFWLTVERRKELPAEALPILIGEPETLGYGDLQKLFARLIHGDPDWTTREVPKAMAKSGAWLQEHTPGMEDPFIKPWMIDLADDHYELDIARARELLGWTPERRLSEAAEKMIAALQSDPQKWYERHGLEAPAAVSSE